MPFAPEVQAVCFDLPALVPQPEAQPRKAGREGARVEDQPSYRESRLVPLNWQSPVSARGQCPVQMVGGTSSVLVWMSSGPHKEVHACIKSEPEAHHYSDHCPRPRGNAKGNRHCENEDVKKSRNETCLSQGSDVHRSVLYHI